MGAAEIVDVSFSIIASVLTILGVIISIKANKKPEQKANQQTLQFNSGINNTINVGSVENHIDKRVDNSNTITYNYTVNNKVENININSNGDNKQENDTFSTIIFMLAGAVISVIVFAYLHLCFFSIMIALIALYTCKNIHNIKQYDNLKEGIIANKYKIIIFLISILCCIFYWLPLSSPPNYPEGIFNFVKNISLENISNIKDYLPSLCLAFSQFMGSVCFIFLYLIPYINSCYQKLKKKINFKKEMIFKYNDKTYIIILVLSLFLLSGVLCIPINAAEVIYDLS